PPAGHRELGDGGCEPAAWRRSTPAAGDAQCRAVDRRQPGLPVAGAIGGVLPGRPAARSATSARPVHGALGALRAARGSKSWALALRRAGRRAGSGPGGVPAPAVRGGRSVGADLASLADRKSV